MTGRERTGQPVSAEAERRPSVPGSSGLLEGLLFPLAILGFWWIGSALGLWNTFLLPSPASVGRAAVRLIRSGDLLRHIGASSLRVFWGFGLSCLTAFPLGVLLGVRPRLGRLVNGTLEFLRHVPPLALLPLLLLWFGIGEASKTAIIVLAAFFPILLNTVDGIRRCDQNLVEVGVSLGLSEGERLRRIRLPWALPSILTGLRLGLGYSWRALIGAELIAASSGLGYLIHDAQGLSRSDIIVVAIVTMGFLGALVDDLFFRLAEHLVPWKGGDGHGRN